MTYKFDHHRETVDRVVARFRDDQDILALILGGSIAHGYATAKSDVDILIVVPDAAYEELKRTNNLLYFDRDLATFEEGYVDGKYISPAYLRRVAERGNEATRYAFKDSELLLSRSDDMGHLVAESARFPLATKEANSIRFYAQMHAWKWYFHEGARHGNDFLVSEAIDNFALFCCRLILNYNEMLYPYLKWLFAETAKAPRKPDGLLDLLWLLISEKKPGTIEAVVANFKAMRDWGLGDWDWPAHFQEDVETVWLRHEPPVADI